MMSFLIPKLLRETLKFRTHDFKVFAVTFPSGKVGQGDKITAADVVFVPSSASWSDLFFLVFIPVVFTVPLPGPTYTPDQGIFLSCLEESQ